MTKLRGTTTAFMWVPLTAERDSLAKHCVAEGYEDA